LQAAAGGKVGCLVLLGADPLGDCPDRDLAARALAGASSIIGIDTFVTESLQYANVVLPAAAFSERAGSTMNIEGRTTSLAAKVTARGIARPDWAIASDLASRLGNDLGFASLAELTAQLPASGGGSATLTASGMATPVLNGYQLRLVVGRKLYDEAVSVRTSHSLAKLAPGASIRLNPTDADHVGARTGTKVRVVGTRGTITVPVVVDSGVPKGVAWLPFNQPDVAVASIIDASAMVNDVTLESV
jgi:NADH-quinone oxidoreductase subunit G